MAKYIGTYASSGDVQTALDNQELNRPFIAYTTDDEKVYFGSAADKAEVGDIVVYSVADDLLHYIKQADYNTTSYPAADYVPVGVVAMPQTDDAILGPSGEITFIGLKWPSLTNPDNGQTIKTAVAWGYNDFDIPELTDYGNSSTAIADMNGKANTEAVLQYATAQYDWKTASAITSANEPGYYPVFECAWRYHTSGTAQGDWYIPSIGQLYVLADANNASVFSTGYHLVTGNNFDLNTFGSTECNKEYTYMFFGSVQTGRIDHMGKQNPYFRTAALYCSKLMTRI